MKRKFQLEKLSHTKRLPKSSELRHIGQLEWLCTTTNSSISMLSRFVIMIVNPLVGLMAVWNLNYTLMILGSIAVVFAIVSRVEEHHLID